MIYPFLLFQAFPNAIRSKSFSNRFDFAICTSIPSGTSKFHLPMTPEEQVRMNELCAAIQEERNYERFSAMLHEMSELIARKEQRRFPDHPKIVWARNKPWTSMSASANKLLSHRMVEIAIPAAEDLFREIRIDNQFTGVDGKPVAITAGAPLTLTLEAEQ